MSNRLCSFIPQYFGVYFVRTGHNYTIVIKIRRLMLILTVELKNVDVISSVNKCKTDEFKP